MKIHLKSWKTEQKKKFYSVKPLAVCAGTTFGENIYNKKKKQWKIVAETALKIEFVK